MSKVELFDTELQKIATNFKTLSHPARLAILKYLAEAKICPSGYIFDKLPLSRTTVHQHIEELKKLNLIKGEIDSIKTNYCLNSDIILKIKESLNSYLTEIDCCNEIFFRDNKEEYKNILMTKEGRERIINYHIKDIDRTKKEVF